MNQNPLSFIESADIKASPRRHTTPLERLESPPLNLDKLPDGIVAGNTLIDYSAAPEGVRGPLSLAMTFASRAASASMRDGDDEDDWFAGYKTNLMRLGFTVSQSAFTRSRFKKRGIAVHNAIIPFLTIALGGAAVGPVILALLQNLKEMDSNQPWITLFDQESRKFETREMLFGAVSSDVVESRMRHVAARLSFIDSQTNVLFFKVTDVAAEFESATTTVSANNSLLAAIEPRLRERLGESIFDFIKDVAI
ncbi:hypothetical protein LB561_09930 [Mesorhizobium sp. B292B1B]|uniref:hypothetical protein n=1 Tax=unclassified Mesorhizobium TaxID=325217 RepID=UPI0011263DAF|nr:MULTISPECIES: hypothetical protein [unclassified Mesorhizobium]MCA0012888.1 hypothetical protein [Mesorhizobium sp. B294B1A1]MCA0037611.1 hypothetical protein [Mesorhizobium sp. B292B1B]TPM50716.1 hypothetical protein FJ964_03095 [Mesorhizobium sp. B2-3-2]